MRLLTAMVAAVAGSRHRGGRRARSCLQRRAQVFRRHRPAFAPRLVRARRRRTNRRRRPRPSPPRRAHKVIDLPGDTLIPGMIEGHSHLFLHPYNERPWDDQVLHEPLALRTARAVVRAEKTLMAGFTTERDLGTEGAGYADVGLKQAIDQGIVPGPRLLVVDQGQSSRAAPMVPRASTPASRAPGRRGNQRRRRYDQGLARSDRRWRRRHQILRRLSLRPASRAARP